MAPHSKKKKTKSSKSTIKETVRQEESESHHSFKSLFSRPRMNKTCPQNQPNDLDKQVLELTEEWDISSQKKELIDLITTKILKIDNIFIDKAVFLGLGSMRWSPLTALPISWSGIGEGSSNVEVEGSESRPGGSEKVYNRILYQLLVFETVLLALRQKFAIQTSILQDPIFTPEDKTFLTNRGHTILEWDQKDHIKKGWIIDPRLGNIVSGSTFCFIQGLYAPAIIELISTAKPTLCLSNHLLKYLPNPIVVPQENSPPEYIQKYKTFLNFVLEKDYINAPGFWMKKGDEDSFGFMWKADGKDEERRKENMIRIFCGQLEVYSGCEDEAWKGYTEAIMERLLGGWDGGGGRVREYYGGGMGDEVWD